MDTKNAEDQTATWLTYKEAQKFSSLGRTTLTALVTSGDIPAAKVGKAVRISKVGWTSSCGATPIPKRPAASDE